MSDLRKALDNLEKVCPYFPGDKELLDESIKALRTALAQEPDDERIAALRTLDYCHGLKAGWNFCVANDDAGFERAIASTSEAVCILKKQKALAQPEQEPVAWLHEKAGGYRYYSWQKQYPDDTPLYTAPPKQPEPTVAEQYAHRLAILLECMILSPEKTWNEANNLISEYHEALQKERIAMGEPYVSGFGKD